MKIIEVGAHPCAAHPGTAVQRGSGCCAGLWGCEGTVARQMGGGEDRQVFLCFALRAGEYQNIRHILFARLAAF